MKTWPGIASVCGLLLVVSAVTADAQHIKIAKKEADTGVVSTAEPRVLKCPKCQGDMEQGFVLDVRPLNTPGGGSDPEPADFVLGVVKGGFFPGLKAKSHRPIDAYHCTSCGYIEL